MDFLYLLFTRNHLTPRSNPIINIEVLTLAVYEGSAGIAPHKGGGFSPGLLINSGKVWADAIKFFINVPRRTASLLPVFRA